MSIVLSDEFLESVGVSEIELWQEIAIALFQKQKISLGKAAYLAKMNQLEFMRLLGKRNIPLHYGIAELEEDLQTLAKMGWT